MGKNWTITAVDDKTPNVHKIEFKGVRAGWEQYVLLTSDRHWDNQHSDRKLQKAHLDRAKELDAPVIDVGDLFDCMGGKYDPRRSEGFIRDEHKVDDYFDALLETATEWFEPYADILAVLGKGNHETAILKRQQIDLTNNLARRLNRRSKKEGRGVLPGGYGGYVLFDFRIRKTVKKRLTLKYYHGSGGGGPVTKGVIQTNRRAVMYPDADFIVSGHVHEAWDVALTRERLTMGGRPFLSNQLHICLPTYKEEWHGGYGGWHVERGAPPKPRGCAWLRLYQMGGGNEIGYSVELDLV